MKIYYSDIQRGSDYYGTKITIVAETRNEWLLVQYKYLHEILEHNSRSECYYKKEFAHDRRTLTFWGYDGFLASVIERIITGNNNFYLGKA